jgi:two-component system, OmpR family, aerobic respiration control sensor histidine kinase ArcB
MSAFDPSLDRSSSWPATGDERELAMLRHDLRDALAGVVGGLARIDRGDVPADFRSQVDGIAESATLLQDLIALAFGDGPSERAAESDLDRLMAHLRNRFAVEARDSNTAFRVEMDPSLPSRVRLDSGALVRMLGNLVRDALEHAAGGAVSVAATASPEEIVFRVAGDRGRAASQPQRRPIEPGRGLGEMVVRTLADRHGGIVDMSRGEGGFEGTLRFPASVAVPAAAATESFGPNLAGLRILLAEDNPTNQMVASSMLRSLNAEVQVCADGVEALERFDTFPADLVIVDIEMPRLTGLDVIRAIRARSDVKAHVPIVALTAYAMREHRDRISAAGANGLIAKPISSIEALGRALLAHVRIGAGQPEQRPEPDGIATAPAIDVRVFDDLCRTIGIDLVGELMEKVVTDLLDGRATLAAALAPLDRAQIDRASHILISVAGAFGAVRLQAQARSLNTNVHDTTIAREAIEGEVRLCIAEIEAAVAFARGRTGGN